MASTGIRGRDYIGVGVGAVILNERQEVLLLLRKRPPEAGYWTIPGGAVEWFETCETAIRRECHEEVGLEIEIDRFLTVVDHIVEADERHWVSMEYLATVSSTATVKACTLESEAFQWFPVDNLPDRITQPTREAIDCYRQA